MTVGRRPQMPRRFDLFAKQQAVEYLCTDWIVQEGTFPALTGDDSLLTAAWEHAWTKQGRRLRSLRKLCPTVLQASVLSVPCCLHWHHYLRCKLEGIEICTLVVDSYAKYLSIQLCQGHICPQMLSPVFPEPWVHLHPLHVTVRRTPHWCYFGRLSPELNKWAGELKGTKERWRGTFQKGL